jgi:uracil-DNA glycosylase
VARLDARRSLTQLNDQWRECTACTLGVRRHEVGGNFVPGTGRPRGILLVGEGPGKDEERLGTPFIGRSGQLLRKMLTRLNATDLCFFSNIVACRSCAPVLDNDGEISTYTFRGVTRIKERDQPPSAVSMEACLPRFYEEMYIVDPLVVVPLGVTAATTLLRKNITIQRDAGHEQHIEIPGMAQLPSLTEKKKQWVRKVRGKLVSPTERNKVRYLAIPTLHPAFVLRSGDSDQSEDSPLRRFFKHLKASVVTYVRLAEYYNIQLDVQIQSDLEADDIEDIID